MPSFQFIVGAALSFALVRRRQQKQPFGVTFRHVIWRCHSLVPCYWLYRRRIFFKM